MQTSIHKSPTSPLRLPPGPPGLPLLGNTLQMGRDLLTFLEQCARLYGDLVRLRLGPTDMYLVNHPSLIEEVLVTSNRNYPKEDINKARHSLDYALFGNGLLTSDGAFWLRQRRLAQPAFHRQRIAAYGVTTVDYTVHTVEQWRDGQHFDIHEAMMQLTLEIVAKTLFDADLTGDAADVGHALDVVMQVSAEQLGQPFQVPSYIPTPSNRRFLAAVRRLDKVVFSIVQQRRASGEDTGDLLSMLLQARDDDGSGMTDKQLRDELITIFLAGHETTALALSWTLYLLARYPEVESRLVEELQSVLGGRPPTLEDLPKLTYTEQVLKESMRLYPPAWTISGRVAAGDTTLGGYDVPKGTVIMIAQWLTHRDARFFPDPLRFDPDRWGGQREKQLPRFAYFPFGGGPRLCIGQSFAMMEARLILATLLQRFQYQLLPDQRVEAQPSITLRPRYGVQVRLVER